MSEKEAHNQLVELIKRNTPNTVFEAEVVSVDQSDLSCEVKPLDERANYTSVRLRPELDGSTLGCYVIPKVNTRVLVAVLDKGASGAAVISVAEPEKWVLKFSESAFIEVNQEGKLTSKGEWTINDGSNGGVPVSSKVAERLNAIENSLIALKAAISAAPIVPTDGGAAFKAGLAPWAAIPLVTTVAAQLENLKVKH